MLKFCECHVYNMSYFSIIQLINPFHPPLLWCPLSLGRGDVNVPFKAEHLIVTSSQDLDQLFSAKKSFLVKAEDLLSYFLLFCTSVCCPETCNLPISASSMWAFRRAPPHPDGCHVPWRITHIPYLFAFLYSSDWIISASSIQLFMTISDLHISKIAKHHLPLFCLMTPTFVQCSLFPLFFLLSSIDTQGLAVIFLSASFRALLKALLLLAH